MSFYFFEGAVLFVISILLIIFFFGLFPGKTVFKASGNEGERYSKQWGDQENDPVVFCRDNAVISMNQAAMDMFSGFCSQKLIGADFSDLLGGDVPKSFLSKVKSSGFCSDRVLIRNDIFYLYGERASGNDVSVKILSRDLVQGNRNLERLMDSIDRCDAGVVVTDLGFNIVDANARFSDISGYSISEVLDEKISILSSGNTSSDIYKQMWQQISIAGFWYGKIWNRRKDGGLFLEQLVINRLMDEGGRVTHYIGVFTDMTSYEAAIKKLSYMEQHFPSSVLPNLQSLQRCFDQKVAEKSDLVVMLIAVHRFERLRDIVSRESIPGFWGHFTQQMKRYFGCQVIFGQVAEDQVAVVLSGDQEGVVATCKRLMNALRQPVLLGDREVSPALNIGIAKRPEHGDSLSQLVRNASLAISTVIHSEGGRIAVFNQDDCRLFAERLEIERLLQGAIERKEFHLCYQPICNASGQLIKLEALLRWTSPELGGVSPAVFIPIAEQSSLIYDIGLWVVDEVLRQQVRRFDETGEWVKVALNISRHQLQDASFVEFLGDQLSRYSVDSRLIEIEITESVLMEQKENAYIVLKSIKEIGISLALDDFGTGYSSLASLMHFPVDSLKIDRAFIVDIESIDTHAPILDAIMTLAANMNLTVVAEGIETQEQLDFMKKFGVDLYQGFLIGKPDFLENIHLDRVLL